VTVFYVYSPDGGPQDTGELEFCGNLSVPQNELQSRAATGLGQAAFVSDLPNGEVRSPYRDRQRVQRDEEWPLGTEAACMWVWWRYAKDGVPDISTERADEVWTLTPEGDVNRRRWANDIRPNKQQKERKHAREDGPTGHDLSHDVGPRRGVERARERRAPRTPDWTNSRIPGGFQGGEAAL